MLKEKKLRKLINISALHWLNSSTGKTSSAPKQW